MLQLNAIELGVFISRLSGVCEEMGAVLRQASCSPNIKERLDYSCAIFDKNGQLLSQAAHIPVHLGSMAFAMRSFATQIDWAPGDQLIVNDPYAGGTHLPDVTIVAPVYIQNECHGFVANRAHHADIGCDSPGSMPLATNLNAEGVVIPPTKWVSAGKPNLHFQQSLFSKMIDKACSEGDFAAQCAANNVGVERMSQLIKGGTIPNYHAAVEQLQKYGEKIARSALSLLADGEYEGVDNLDSDGAGADDIQIKVSLSVKNGKIVVNFAGTADQVTGNVNCPLPVTVSAVYYVFRCLMPAHSPACAGLFNSIDVIAPSGSVVNANYPAAVAAGNVETSSRVVDVVLRALSLALPDAIPAASQGTMNNVAFGSRDAGWAYYETIGGGCGAGPRNAGLSATQSHMTNTLNTPAEVIEQTFPLRIKRYEIRANSGGLGEHCGGNGIIREYEFLQPASVTLLTERRKSAPYGLAGGLSGKFGENFMNGSAIADKIATNVDIGDVLRIETPGGGGFGELKK